MIARKPCLAKRQLSADSGDDQREEARARDYETSSVNHRGQMEKRHKQDLGRSTIAAEIVSTRERGDHQSTARMRAGCRKKQ